MSGRFSRRHLGRYLVTVLVVAVAAYTITTLVELPVVLRTLSSVSVPVYLLAVPAYYATVPVRTARWRLLLREMDVEAERWPAMTVVFLSLFLNTVLPAKAGDLYRAHVGARLLGSRRSAVLGTVTVERTLDLSVLLVGVAVSLVGISSVGVSGGRRLLLFAVVLVMVLALLTVVVVLAPRVGLPDPLDRYVKDFYAGFTTVSGPRTFASVLGLTVLLWGLNVVRIWVVVLATGLDLGLSAVVLVALFVSVLTGLPYTPAGIGVVEVAGTTLLLALGADGGVGFSIVLLDRLVSVGSVVVVGGVVYLLADQYRLVATAETDL